MFSYCESTGDDDPWGVANLDTRSIIDRIYIGYHQLLLHTKYKSSGAHGLREDFFFIFSYFMTMGDDDPLGVANLDQGHDWQDLCRVPLNIATH